MSAVVYRMVPGLSNPATRQTWMSRIEAAQRHNETHGAPEQVGNYRYLRGERNLDASGFVDALRQRFASPVRRQDNRGFADVQFADVTLDFRGADDSHAIMIQHIGDSSHYATDRYQLYDTNYGVYEYPNFNALAEGLRDVFDNGYRDWGGVSTARVDFYSYQAPGTSNPSPPASSSPSSRGSSFPPSPASSPEIAVQSPSGDHANPSTCDSPMASYPAWHNIEATLHAYAEPSESFHTLSQSNLGSVAGMSMLDHACPGLTATVLQQVTSGAQPDLHHALNGILDDLADPGRRPVMAALLQRNQYESGAVNNVPESISGYDLHPGQTSLDAGSLIADLHAHVAAPQVSNDGRGLETQPLAMVNLSFRNGGDAHAILIQRVQPSGDYLHDQYQLYDPNVGAIRYDGFDHLSQGLRNVFAGGYPVYGGVRAASTFFYSDRGSRADFTRINPAPDPLPVHHLSTLIGFDAGEDIVPPDPHLPPPPPFDLFNPFGFIGGFGDASDMKRDTFDPSLQPKAVFRPSLTAPVDLKRSHGFYTLSPTLENTNLNLHNYKMASAPSDIDGGGYLGTFYDRNTAQWHLRAMGNSGYLYLAAPSPQMIDTMGSLGARHMRTGALVTHDSHEAAAMGGIGWTQIRGWQKVENGVLGPYQTNPDYRWDIYDQTRTSGARPELAHFSADDPAWSDTDHAPYVRAVTENGRTVYHPNEDPAAANARFLVQARNALQRLRVDQEYHNEYRGPITFRPYWDNEGAEGSTRLTIRDGYVSVNNWTSGNSAEQFYMDNVGRLHAAHDYGKVVRIDSGGNAWAGAAPEDSANLNGVFRYDKARATYWGTLTHAEDGKLLTEGRSAYTPFVETPPASKDVLQRQKWTLRDPSGHDVQPPVPKSRFRGYTVADENLLYQFYRDPNIALPKGATHFVTATFEVPAGVWSSYPGKYGPRNDRDAINRNTYDWLRQHNAALLFRDGYYATTGASRRGVPQLDIRRIDGAPVWSATFDPVAGRPVTSTYGASATVSNYVIPAETWNHVNFENEQFNTVLTRLTTPPSATSDHP